MQKIEVAFRNNNEPYAPTCPEFKARSPYEIDWYIRARIAHCYQ